MAESDVRQLVRQHTSELRLIVRGFDGAAVHKHISAEQSKSIDGLVIHAMKFEGVLYATRGQLLRQTRAQFRQVGIDPRCIAERQLLSGIRGSALAKSYVVLRRKLVPTLPEFRSLRQRARNQDEGQAQKEARHQSAMRPGRPEPSTSVSSESYPFRRPDAHDDLPEVLSARMALLHTRLHLWLRGPQRESRGG